MENFLKTVFSILIMIAMLGGGLVFLMFLLALLLGGDLGATIAVNARSLVMPYFIRLASIAVLSGLIVSYMTDRHGLSL